MNQVKYLKETYGTKNKFLSKVTNISEPRLSRLSKLSDEEYIAKVYADEYIKLNRIIEAK
jgi:hypothetical protein